jgi:peptidoglycan/LPS O-acetylase OafA/YrhL
MEDRSRIGTLDAWRFIAVWMVIQGHAWMFSNLSVPINTYAPFIRRLTRFGNVGVLVFFVISGFVICRGLIRNGIQGFYVRRFFRILPPLWIYLVTLAALAAWGVIRMTPEQLGWSAALLCNFDVNCGWYGGHTWSLAYEEQFYLAFPLLFLVLKRQYLLPLLGTCIGGSIVTRTAGIQVLPDYLMIVGFLLTGCAAAVHEQRVRAFCDRIDTKQWLWIACALAVCVGLLPGEIEIYVRTIFYPFAMLALMMATPRWRFFASERIHHLGRISYTVYLWQQLATATWRGMPWWGTLVMIAAVWLFALASWRYFEEPLIQIAKARTAREPLPAGIPSR